MERSSILYQQYTIQSSQSLPEFESISPLRASIDPRFSSLFTRAAAHQERLNQRKVNPDNRLHSPSFVRGNSNAWLPETSTTNIDTTNLEP